MTITTSREKGSNLFSPWGNFGRINLFTMGFPLSALFSTGNEKEVIPPKKMHQISVGSKSGKRLSVQKTFEARDGFTELQGWINAFF